MKAQKWFFTRAFKVLSVVAMAVSVVMINGTCGGPSHQPSIPDGMKKFNRFHG